MFIIIHDSKWTGKFVVMKNILITIEKKKIQQK